MLNLGVVKCDLFCARKALFLIKMFCEMRTVDVILVNSVSIVQISAKISSEVDTYWKGLYVMKEIRSLCKGT